MVPHVYYIGLDLIICVDAHIGHIAATMGKETWIMLSYVPDFRWRLKSSKTTWYKDVRLFIQISKGKRKYDNLTQIAQKK